MTTQLLPAFAETLYTTQTSEKEDENIQKKVLTKTQHFVKTLKEMKKQIQMTKFTSECHIQFQRGRGSDTKLQVMEYFQKVKQLDMWIHA